MYPLDCVIRSGILTLPGTMGRGFFSLMGKMAHDYPRVTRIVANRNEFFLRKTPKEKLQSGFSSKN